jgi:RNA polymerase sigma factor (sigma-70 family)
VLDIDDCYRRYGPMVYRRCHQLLRDGEKASDALHDVFVQVLRHEGGLRSPTPSSLLNRIATNVCLNRLRAESYRQADGDEDVLHAIAHSDDLEDRTGARALLEWIFGREQTSTRTLAVLHLVDGMTLEEVAAEVGLSVSGVRKRLRTLRTRLQALQAAEVQS